MSDASKEIITARWDVPLSWSWTSMGEVSKVMSGGTPKTAESSYFGGAIPWITPADLSGYTAKGIDGGERSLTEAGLENSSAVLLPAGTILFSSRAPIGYVAIAGRPLATNQGFKNFVLKKGLLPDYVYYYLQHAKPIAVSMASGTTFLEISARRVAELPIPIAPVQEQIRIVAKIEELLSDLDAGVSALRRAQANLKRYRAAVLRAAVTGELTAAWRAAQPNIEPANKLLDRILSERRRKWEGKFTDDLPSLPDGWCWASVAQVAEVQGGIQKQPKRQPKTNAFPYLRVANVFRNRLDLKEVLKIELFGDELSKLRLQDGDLLVVEGNGSRNEIGRSALWRGEIKDCIHQNHIIRVRFLVGLPGYLNAYWNSWLGRRKVMEKAASTSGLYTLSVAKVSQLPVPLPPLAEQEIIVSEVEQRLSIIAATENYLAASLKRSARLRQSILKEAFAGRLVAQDGHDEPASALLQRIRAERQSTIIEKAKPSRKRRGVKRPTQEKE